MGTRYSWNQFDECTFLDIDKGTYSNDIREVLDVLGIEAARQVLYNEFNEVMEFADAYINYHHLNL